MPHAHKEERNIVNRRKISAVVLFFGGTAETFVRHLTKGTAERRIFFTEGGGPDNIFPSPLQLLPGGMGRAAMHASPRRGRAAVNALLRYPPACHQAALPSGSRVTLDNIDVAHAHVLLTS